MKEIAYQQKAINELVTELTAALGRSGLNQKIVFNAPTGSGKTYMTLETLRRMAQTLPTTFELSYREAAFIWIAPNSLHEQSYRRMCEAFGEDFALRPLKFTDIDPLECRLHPFDILCLNWQSVNSENNILVRDNERDFNFYRVCERTRDNNVQIVVIIDEEHLFTGRNAKQSNEVLSRIHPKAELRISATPITTDAQKTISIVREDVVAEQMIKRKIVLNPNLVSGVDAKRSLLQQALQHRTELAEAYRAAGAKVNPLLLIQLPNDSKETMTADERTLRDNIEAWLAEEDITTSNGKLAIWLAGEDENREGLEKPDNLAQVLIFKQAIAMGWDCPRAAVLLIYRELKSFTFTTQTVGRIMRMPEQKHYQEERLNDGYVYTDLSADIIRIEADFINMNNYLTAYRREGLRNVELPSYYAERKAEKRRRLRPTIKRHLFTAFAEELGLRQRDKDDSSVQNRQIAQLRGLNTNAQDLEVEIAGHTEFWDEHTTSETGTVRVEKKIRFARNATEVMNQMYRFCKQQLGSEFEAQSVVTLRSYLTEVVTNIFGYHEEKDCDHAARFCLYKGNESGVTRVVERALNLHKQENLYVRGGRSIKPTGQSWSVPQERRYNAEQYEENTAGRHSALWPCLLAKNASQPEKDFVFFLEQHRDKIDWWYKNGDSGIENFAVPYPWENPTSLFYVDFIIRAADGTVYLLDTKTPGSDPRAAEKHNALIRYISENSTAAQPLRGGIVIHDNDQWKYCRYLIDNTTNLAGWETVF